MTRAPFVRPSASFIMSDDAPAPPVPPPLSAPPAPPIWFAVTVTAPLPELAKALAFAAPPAPPVTLELPSPPTAPPTPPVAVAVAIAGLSPIALTTVCACA